MPPRKKKTSSPDYLQLGKMVVEASEKNAACKLAAGLYVVATPIGHMGDISLRALATLGTVDAIACEDTRTSGLLLSAFGIKKPSFSYHDHNENLRGSEILRRIEKGEAIALISDAGMPLIADPGFKLVRDCRAAGYNVNVIPGANAAVTAMASSGLATDRFYFAGFLPAKTAARRKTLLELRGNDATLIFYETPQRLAASLSDMAQTLGPQRPAAIARELTKMFEEVKRGSLQELTQYYSKHEVKGEIVVLVGRDENEPKAVDLDALLVTRMKEVSLRDAVAEAAEISGRKKSEVYARALELAPQARRV